MRVEYQESPNQNSRPADVKPSLIVVHGTAGSTAGDRSWILSPQAKVSYHVHVGADGSLVRFVTDDRRAWHAGVSEWKGRKNVNDFSLGIGLAGFPPGDGFTDDQYEAAGWAIRRWLDWYSLDLDAVVGHAHVSWPRKTDPWGKFHWMKLAKHIG